MTPPTTQVVIWRHYLSCFYVGCWKIEPKHANHILSHWAITPGTHTPRSCHLPHPVHTNSLCWPWTLDEILHVGWRHHAEFLYSPYCFCYISFNFCLEAGKSHVLNGALALSHWQSLWSHTLLPHQLASKEHNVNDRGPSVVWRDLNSTLLEGLGDDSFLYNTLYYLNITASVQFKDFFYYYYLFCFGSQSHQDWLE